MSNTVLLTKSQCHTYVSRIYLLGTIIFNLTVLDGLWPSRRILHPPPTGPGPWETTVHGAH